MGILKGKTVFIFINLLVFASCKQNEISKKSTPVAPEVFNWEHVSPESQGISFIKLEKMKDVLAEKGTQKLLIIKNDKVVYDWFAPGFEDSLKTHYTASLAKALVGGMSLSAALDDGYIHLDESASNLIPSWKKDNLKSKITIRQLATHTSGIEDAKASEKEEKDMISQGLDRHFDLPEWKGQFWKKEYDPFLVAREDATIIFAPGSEYSYSNPGIGMLTYAVTASLKGSKYNDIREYLKKRIFEPIGIEEKEYTIGYGKTYEQNGLVLVPSWGGGDFTARSIGRIGLLMLHKGNWLGRQLIDSSIVEKVTTYCGTAVPLAHNLNGVPGINSRTKRNPQPATTAGWYSNFDGVWESVPRDAFAGGGAGNQHLMVIPSLKMVIVRMGNDLYADSKDEGFWLGAEKYLFNPIMDAITESPYPQSSLSAEFPLKEKVIRKAQGGDNWPVTWGDDDNLYTAYGDGNGFLPNTDIKLSLGLAKVNGNPPFVEGINIRSRSGEKVGQGMNGVKASGILMVDGVIYMLVRNVQNAQLMWSADHGESWEDADWKFDVSFGCPTFLNYGKNYEGATDDYVYIYSQDEANAYKNSDQFVLARVPKNQIRNWSKYEYFADYDINNKPQWSDDIRKREPVFTNPGKCYRSGITYNKGLKKYLWCQTIQMSHSRELKDVRFRGGLGIFESDNPWGPWKTVYYSRDWDIGPGEMSSIPTKWMSEDGTNGYLLFSGEDCFSIRKLMINKK